MRELENSGDQGADGFSPLSGHYQGLDVPFVVCGDLFCAELLLPCDTTCRTNTLWIYCVAFNYLCSCESNWREKKVNQLYKVTLRFKVTKTFAFNSKAVNSQQFFMFYFVFDLNCILTLMILLRTILLNYSIKIFQQCKQICQHFWSFACHVSLIMECHTNKMEKRK